MASSSIPLPSILNPNPKSCHSLHFNASSRSVASAFSSSARVLQFRNPSQKLHPKTAQIRRISAVTEDAPVPNSEQIIAGGDDSGSTIVSVLLLVAFIGLSILTIGVIYIAVTDFLQKREREKFEKEETGKKGGVKRIGARARARPRGFGQKIEEEEEDDD